MRTHRYAVGQHVAMLRTVHLRTRWRRKIIFLLRAGNREPQYQIRSAGQNYDSFVWESQLQDDLGARGRCA